MYEDMTNSSILPLRSGNFRMKIWSRRIAPSKIWKLSPKYSGQNFSNFSFIFWAMRDTSYFHFEISWPLATKLSLSLIFNLISKYSNFISFVANSLILEPIMQCKLHNWFSLSLTFSGPFDFPAIRQRPKMLLPSFLLSLSCILSPILVNCEKWSPLLHHHHHQLEDLTAQESRLGWTNE